MRSHTCATVVISIMRLRQCRNEVLRLDNRRHHVSSSSSSSSKMMMLIMRHQLMMLCRQTTCVASIGRYWRQVALCGSSHSSCRYPHRTHCQWRFWGFHLGEGHWGGDTFIWGHTTNTFALNYRVCNRLYQIINT